MAYGNVSLTAGMRSNLITLQQTNDLMERTQTRLATGRKVNTALDDPVKYFAALGHTQRANDLAYRKSDMNEAIQTIKAASNGIDSISGLIESARSLAQSAMSIDATGTQNLADRTALSVQFNEVMSQIDSLAGDSGYKGINLLSSGSSLTVAYDETGSSSSTVNGFDATSDGLTLNDAANTWQTQGDVTAAIAQLDTARDNLRTQTKSLTTSLSTITTRLDFTKNMINTLEDGAAKLTLADMNEEGANMLMLQTRQALGTTSLSMASQAAQAVLRLF